MERTKSSTFLYRSNSVRAKSRISSRVEEGGIPVPRSVRRGSGWKCWTRRTVNGAHDVAVEGENFLALDELSLVSMDGGIGR